MSASPAKPIPSASAAPAPTGTAADPSRPAVPTDRPMSAAELQNVPHARYMGAQKTKRCRSCGHPLPSSKEPTLLGIGYRVLLCTDCAIKRVQGGSL